MTRKRRKNFTIYRQLDRTDCGPTCLRMIAKHHGKVYSLEYLREKSHITRQGVSVMGIADAAEAIGMHSLAVNVNYETLRDKAPLPCIAYWRKRHFVVVYEVQGDKVHVADPDHGKIVHSREEFMDGWGGNTFNANADEGLLVLLEPTPEFYTKETPDKDNKAAKGLRFLLPYFRPFRGWLGQLMIGLLVGSLLQLAFPFLTQSIVDYGIRNQNLHFIYLVLLGQLMVFFSQTGIEVIRGWLLLHLGARINIAILSDYLNKLMRLPVSFFDSRITGDIMQRVEDNQRLEQFLSTQSLTMLFSLFNIGLFLVVLFYYHIGIGLVFLLGALLYVGWILLFMKRRAELDYRRFDEASGNSSSMIQLITGIQEIKLNNSEKRRRWEWESIQIRLFNISVKGLALAQAQGSGAVFINELKNIIITFLAATAVVAGDMTLGMMLAVQYIIGQLNTPLNNFINFARTAQDAKLSLERIGQVYDEADEQPADADRMDALPEDKSISLEGNLTFRYGSPKSQPVLQQLNLHIPQGKVTAVVGVSGSGKTTLLRLLLKFYAPQEGTIRVGPVPLEHLDTNLWRQRCGVVMQDGFIFNDTIARNITESDSEGLVDKERLQHAVHVANAEEFIERLPAGYLTRIGPAGSSGVALSGGQRQRILIARAVYKNPDFLFFDEATSALDANNEKVIMENLEQFFQGKTVVVIAHRLSTVKNADNIVVIDRGQIVEQGSHEALTAKRGAYYTLVKNQLELGD